MYPQAAFVGLTYDFFSKYTFLTHTALNIVHYMQPVQGAITDLSLADVELLSSSLCNEVQDL